MEHTKQIVLELIEANIIPMVMGPPGVGKTCMAEEAANAFNLELRDLRLAQFQGTDIGGFPYVKEGILQMADSGDMFFPLEHTPLPEGKDGWLVFLDELTLAEFDTLKVVLRVLNERKLGKHSIHSKVRFLAAGNPKGKGSMGNHLPDAIVDRMAFVHVDYSFDSWLIWARKNGIHPDLLEALEANPLDNKMFGPQETKDKPFISNRSLQQVSDYLYTGKCEIGAILAIAGENLVHVAQKIRYVRTMPEVVKPYAHELEAASTINAVNNVIKTIGKEKGYNAISTLGPWFVENTMTTSTMFCMILDEVGYEPDVQEKADKPRKLV